MEKASHWLDLDGTLWVTDAKWWIIDKEDPSVPLFKITQEEGALSVSGHYKGTDNMIDYCGTVAWLSPRTIKKIKKLNVTIDRIGISYREFEEDKYLEAQADNMLVLIEHIQHLDDTKDDVSLLTARGNRHGHEKLVSELKRRINDAGINISIDKVYFVNDRKFTRHAGTSAIKKTYILLEHLVGFRIKDDAFQPVEQEWYHNVNFYDDEFSNVQIAEKSNDILSKLLSNTEDNLRSEIIDNLNEDPRTLYVHAVTTNKENPFNTSKIEINAKKTDKPVQEEETSN